MGQAFFIDLTTEKTLFESWRNYSKLPYKNQGDYRITP